jgi:SAM-dependent methyltransferase
VKEVDLFTREDQQVMAVAANYNAWLFNLLVPYLGQRVFEIGSGVGNLSRKILSHPAVDHLSTIEVDQACFQAFEAAVLKSGMHKDVLPMFGDFLEADLPREQYDTVVCLNVLEHLQDDRRAIQRAFDLLVPGGRLVAYVPAFNFLMGTIDHHLGHFRRYARPRARSLLRQVGFELGVMRYYNCVGFFSWFVNFRVLKRETQSLVQVRFFDRFVFPLLSRIEFFTAWQPIGQSLFFVGLKPGR